MVLTPLAILVIHLISDATSDLAALNHQRLETICNCSVGEQFSELSQLSFNTRQIAVSITGSVSLYMFEKSGLLSHFNISLSALDTFIHEVQKGYRRLPFHNWIHGFSVLHFSFALIQKCRLIERRHLSPLEGLALLTAAMCHDLDHPGNDNLFQRRTNSSLAQKYNNQGSILERHHITQTFEILKHSETNFINNFQINQQEEFKELIREFILATDPAENRKQFQELKDTLKSSNGFNKMNEHHRKLLRSLIISCADISDQSKDWSLSLDSASKFFEEQLRQEELLNNSKEMSIVHSQVTFVTDWVVPHFELLNSLYNETSTSLENIHHNLNYWKKSEPYYISQEQRGRKPLDILKDDYFKSISAM